MWTWVTDTPKERERVLIKTLAPLLGRSPEDARGQVCVGPPADCAALLSRCGRGMPARLWPLGDEGRQLERVAREVLPEVEVRADWRRHRERESGPAYNWTPP